MKRWGDFEQERRLRGPVATSGYGSSAGHGQTYSSGAPTAVSSYGLSAGTGGKRGHERTPSNLQYGEKYDDYP